LAISKVVKILAFEDLWLISPTFYQRICANFLAPKSLTYTSSTKELCAKLLYEKAASKMLVKLTSWLTPKDSRSSKS
jgi:hypothetical protein